MKYFFIISLFIIAACSSPTDSISVLVKQQVESYKDSLSGCFDAEQLDIVWYNDTVVKGDTIIYKFDVPCQLGEDYKNRIMPLEYKAIVVDDSLIDILRYWDLFNNWVSEFPDVFNPKDLKYWSEIDDSTSFQTIISDNVNLMEIDFYGDSEWIEYYSGHVEIEIFEGTLYCDSAKWRPKQGVLEIPSYGKLIQLNENKDTIQIINGSNWEFDADGNNYKIGNMTGITNVKG